MDATFIKDRFSEVRRPFVENSPIALDLWLAEEAASCEPGSPARFPGNREKNRECFEIGRPYSDEVGCARQSATLVRSSNSSSIRLTLPSSFSLKTADL